MKTKDLLWDYIKSIPENTREAVIKDIINQWECERMASEYEYIVDARSIQGLKRIAEYGYDIMRECLNDTEHRFFLVGRNFGKPKAVRDIESLFAALVDDIAETYELFPENYEPMIPMVNILKTLLRK